ncbi:MAG TPA: hypothetical protein VFJ43_16785 [Bacteroidia bacterium]|nr:hypothetical protein [Bacteroidia bacterium]
MVKKKKYTSRKEKPEEEFMVNEPSMNYVSVPGKNLAETFKTITVSSFKDQEEDMRKYSASLSPLQRMAYLYQLNQVAFAHILSNPKKSQWKKEIIIDKNHDYIP